MRLSDWIGTTCRFIKYNSLLQERLTIRKWLMCHFMISGFPFPTTAIYLFSAVHHHIERARRKTTWHGPDQWQHSTSPDLNHLCPPPSCWRWMAVVAKEKVFPFYKFTTTSGAAAAAKPKPRRVNNNSIANPDRPTDMPL